MTPHTTDVSASVAAAAQIAVGPGTAIDAVLGVGTAAGVLLVVAGWRGPDPARPHRLRDLVARLLARTREDDTALSSRASTSGAAGGGRPVGLRVAVFLATTVIAAWVTGWVVGGALAGIGVWALPTLLGRDPEHRLRLARIEAIATWTEMLRDTLSAAAGLEQAILATTALAPAAISDEITHLAADIAGGDRLAPALRRLGQRLDDPVGDLVIAALVLASEQQTRQLPELLGSLADAARGQASMRMRVEAGRARTRTSVRVIVGTTLGFAVAVVLLNRPYLRAYDDATGQLVLLGIGALYVTGFAWLGRITRIPRPDRILATTPTDPADGPDKHHAHAAAAGIGRRS